MLNFLRGNILSGEKKIVAIYFSNHKYSKDLGKKVIIQF